MNAAYLPAYLKLLATSGQEKPYNFGLQDCLMQSIYWGAIGALAGKCFTNMTPINAAVYGMAAGTLDQFVAQGFYSVVNGKESPVGNKSNCVLQTMAEYAITMIAIYAVSNALFGLRNLLAGGLQKIKTRWTLNPITYFEISNALILQTSIFGVSTVQFLLFLYDKENSV